MKKYFHALAMTCSMFCAVPSPFRVWDEEARPLMMLFLPVVGLEIGAIWALCAFLAQLLKLPTLITAFVLCAVPYVATGYMHLDGFMDVTDALRSWRDLARRREILKDSHVGSFAVIAVVLLILAQFACFASAKEDADFRILLLIPMVTRACAGLAVTGLRPMETSQYAGDYRARIPKAHLWILGFVVMLTIAVGFLLCGKYGFALLAGAAGYCLGLRRGFKHLDGMNGDISGYALTIGELISVAVYALI